MEKPDHRTTGRILDLLDLVSRHSYGLGFTELSKLAGIPKGSLHPLLETLVRRNYVSYDGRTRRYMTGPELFKAGMTYISSNELLELIRQEIKTLASALKESVYFSVLAGGDSLYLITMDAFTKIKVVTTPGRRLPAYSTACGKALLSRFTLKQLQLLYPDGLKKVTENTIDSFDVLSRQLEDVRKSGFSYEEEESTPYIRCVGAPVQYRDRCLAGLSVAVPVLRYDGNSERDIKARLQESKMQIERLIADNLLLWRYS